MQRRQATGPTSEQQNTGFADVLLAITLIFCSAALAGAVWLVVQLINGAMSLRAAAIVMGLAALAAVLSLINKAKQSNQ